MIKKTTSESKVIKPRKATELAVKAKRPAVKKAAEKAEVKTEAKTEVKTEVKPIAPATALESNRARYIFATGRRKTSIANVRLFEGRGENLVNRKPLEEYFSYEFHRQEIFKPFHLTGLGKNYHFTAQLTGGGTHAQAVALRHGLAIALSKTSEETRKILKKNGLLTRDDRIKERKKPGLKRARRAPQWAKR